MMKSPNLPETIYMGFIPIRNFPALITLYRFPRRCNANIKVFFRKLACNNYFELLSSNVQCHLPIYFGCLMEIFFKYYKTK